jgi:hypothetical protein
MDNLSWVRDSFQVYINGDKLNMVRENDAISLTPDEWFDYAWDALVAKHTVTRGTASNPFTHEPDPVRGKEVVLPYVLYDLQKRADVGRKKYGTLLETHNGRDALMDAYQESCDLCMYLRQVILERDGK